MPNSPIWLTKPARTYPGLTATPTKGQQRTVAADGGTGQAVPYCPILLVTKMLLRNEEHRLSLAVAMSDRANEDQSLIDRLSELHWTKRLNGRGDVWTASGGPGLDSAAGRYRAGQKLRRTASITDRCH